MNVLELNMVTKRFGAKTALDGVSLVLEEGFMMGIVGANGAGKTTLMKAILGLVNIDGGRVSILGEDGRASGAQLRDRIGFVHESDELFEEFSPRMLDRVLQAAYSRWNRRRFFGYLDRFGLPQTAKLKTFSKGMKMRCALAAALSHEAELLVLDEPSSGLDPMMRRDLLDLLAAELENEHRSVLFSTHITSDIDGRADFVAIIERGRILDVFNQDQLSESLALCKGPNDLLDRLPTGILTGVVRGEFGFAALTADRETVRSVGGDSVVFERPTIEDVMVHTTCKGGLA